MEIDPEDVLRHLNTYGITSIGDEKLRYFIKDLKTIIKYEERRRNFENKSICEHTKYTVAKNYFTDASTQTHPINQDTVKSATDYDYCARPKMMNVEYAINNNQHNVQYITHTDKENIRPSSNPNGLRSRARSQSRQRKLLGDPVALYQYYQSIWKNHKLPGENDHSELRKMIRDRMMTTDHCQFYKRK